MEIHTEETKKTFINDELENGYTIGIVVDHMDKDAPFEFDIDIADFGWTSKADVLKIKKMINKALSIL